MQVSAVAPVGAGALALELARLRQQLEAEGLFDAARKRPLPLFPRVIGVVTSPTGAVWQDIQNVTRRRYPLAELRLSPAAVQGDGAAGQIARAIGRLNAEKRAEVIMWPGGAGRWRICGVSMRRKWRGPFSPAAFRSFPGSATKPTGRLPTM